MVWGPVMHTFIHGSQSNEDDWNENSRLLFSCCRHAVSFSTKDSSTAASLCGKDSTKDETWQAASGFISLFCFWHIEKNISKLFFFIGHWIISRQGKGLIGTVTFWFVAWDVTYFRTRRNVFFWIFFLLPNWSNLKTVSCSLRPNIPYFF